MLVELESAGEARRIAAAGEDLGLRPRVAVRVNPDFAVKGSGMRMGGGPQQFGVDVEQTPAMLELVADLDLRLEGFHVFAGSQNLQADVLVEAQRRTAELVLALADKCADAADVRQPRRRLRHPLLRPRRAAGRRPGRQTPCGRWSTTWC